MLLPQILAIETDVKQAVRLLEERITRREKAEAALNKWRTELPPKVCLCSVCVCLSLISLWGCDIGIRVSRRRGCNTPQEYRATRLYDMIGGERTVLRTGKRCDVIYIVCLRSCSSAKLVSLCFCS